MSLIVLQTGGDARRTWAEGWLFQTDWESGTSVGRSAGCHEPHRSSPRVFPC